MEESFDYGKAYQQVSNDLKNAIAERDRLDARILRMRQILTSLEASCEDQGIEIEPSLEAIYLVETSTLPEEILRILRHIYPKYHRAKIIQHTLEAIGHDFSGHQNPLATIHMVLKRLIEAGKVEVSTNKAGEKLFRAVKDWNIAPPEPRKKK